MIFLILSPLFLSSLSLFSSCFFCKSSSFPLSPSSFFLCLLGNSYLLSSSSLLSLFVRKQLSLLLLSLFERKQLTPPSRFIPSLLVIFSRSILPLLLITFSLLEVISYSLVSRQAFFTPVLVPPLSSLESATTPFVTLLLYFTLQDK